MYTNLDDNDDLDFLIFEIDSEKIEEAEVWCTYMIDKEKTKCSAAIPKDKVVLYNSKIKFAYGVEGQLVGVQKQPLVYNYTPSLSIKSAYCAAGSAKAPVNFSFKKWLAKRKAI